MLKLLLGSFLVISVLTISCSKNANTTNPETLKTSLWPLKFGNSWVYVDSTFSDSSFTGAYPDTALVLRQTLTDAYGSIYFEVSDPYGWFGTGGYFSVDPTNTTINAYDSVSNSNYLFFQIASQDGTLIGSGSDFTNPTCPVQESQYGFLSTTNIAGYSCFKNIAYNNNCNGVTEETIIIYMAPGAGVVRIEDYVADSTKNNALYLQYSQTLVSEALN
jgi:hypothetical protein